MTSPSITGVAGRVGGVTHAAAGVSGAPVGWAAPGRPTGAAEMMPVGGAGASGSGDSVGGAGSSGTRAVSASGSGAAGSGGDADGSGGGSPPGVCQLISFLS